MIKFNLTLAAEKETWQVKATGAGEGKQFFIVTH